ncbi:MAG: heparan-alpha-glucosaminide N-acetyltransferase domain-containing protein, partial [Isosphaeraceae bacterium]
MATILLPEPKAAPPRLDVVTNDLPLKKAVLPRLDSVDLLRGLVMVVMVLDHTRDYFTNAMLSPMDLETTTPGLFMTRWITHFCAPVFVFLAGTGVFLAATRGKTRPQLARFLVSRGLWLIFLDVTVVRFAITFNLDYQYVPLGVLWAIGASMIALAALIFLPISMVAAVGLTMIAGHNLLDGIQA